jgi:7TM-HD extracellular
MVIVKQIQSTCALALVCVSLRTGAAPAYNVGDKAAQDLVATIPFDVVDAPATAALKNSQGQGIAAIYHQYNGQTNVMARNFSATFDQAHQSFSKAVSAAYHQPTIDNPTIEASDFGYLVTDYNVQHKKFPLTTELAVTWARGGSGAELRDKWLKLLLAAMNHPVQPDKVPAHFVYRKKIRVMPVTNVNEQFTFSDAWHHGHIISEDNLPTISSVRTKFRHQFSEADQPLASALTQFLEPDCFPDTAMTKDARDYSERQVVVSDHFDAGQVIVHRGDTIDAQALAALMAMDKAMMPGTLNQQIEAVQQRAQQEHDLAQAEQERAQVEQQAAQQAQQQQQQAQVDRALAQNRADQERAQAEDMRQQALNAQEQAQEIRTRNDWLMAALGTVSVLALLILWRFLAQRRAGASLVPATVPATLRRMDTPPVPSPAAELAPYLAQTLKDALVQGLAAQRAELLEAQRQAATEIAELVHRLDALQAPMQDRIRAYQERIQELQKDLAERTAENRELLKMKIEMMRRQIEAERARVTFN